MKADRSKSLEEAKTYLSVSIISGRKYNYRLFPIPFELTSEDFKIPVSELLKRIEQAT